jgi:UDP-3-O-[3-hydroxymyristoyl] glucosamine N-acyltransferase
VALRLADIVDALGGDLHGDRAQHLIDGLAPLANGWRAAHELFQPSQVPEQLVNSAAGCVIVSPDFEGDRPGPGGRASSPSQPYLYFARDPVVEAFDHIGRRAWRHPSAVIDPAAQIDPVRALARCA